MAHHQIFQPFKQSFDPDVELINNFPGLYQTDEYFNFHSSINSILDGQLVMMNGGAMDDDKQRKKKAMDMKMMMSTRESTCPYSSPPPNPNKRRGRGRGKKGRDKEEEKAGEVIHVRAKRGQATDSHSLAERVRRGKINERLRCLQDIVPGCYKTMGMAVMLDEIINYVQSLQNQVEFLSMKLTAASSFYDFNTDTYAIEAMRIANAFEVEEIKAANVANQGPPSAQLPHNFAYDPHTTSGFNNRSQY